MLPITIKMSLITIKMRTTKIHKAAFADYDKDENNKNT